MDTTPAPFGVVPGKSQRMTQRHVLHAICLRLVTLGLLLSVAPAWAGPPNGLVIMDSPAARIAYPNGREQWARRVAAIVPQALDRLRHAFGWTLPTKPTVVLARSRAAFLDVSPNRLALAFAVPSRHMIVIDYTTATEEPFSLETTLVHEFCHLVLHAHIAEANLPRWLDEGLSQWVSGGLDELLTDPTTDELRSAAIGGRLMPFSTLRRRFPGDARGMRLAYGQSRDFVTFLTDTYGVKTIRGALARMASGMSAAPALSAAIGHPLSAEEARWQRQLSGVTAWLSVISAWLYPVLFFAGALVTIIAFVRYRIRKKRYQDLDEWEPMAPR